MLMLTLAQNISTLTNAQQITGGEMRGQFDLSVPHTFPLTPSLLKILL